MSVSSRIIAIRLIEKIDRNAEYCEKLGISYTSEFHGKKAENGRRVDYEKQR